MEEDDSDESDSENSVEEEEEGVSEDETIGDQASLDSHSPVRGVCGANGQRRRRRRMRKEDAYEQAGRLEEYVQAQ